MFKKENFGRWPKPVKLTKKILLAGLTLFLLGIGFLCWKNWKKPLNGIVQITFNQKGFTPNQILIEKGTEVVFKNQSGRDFWPATDFYPGNGNYPGFDPQGPINDGREWRFRFDNVGEWGYHDHLSPIHIGTITVSDGGNIRSAQLDCKKIDLLDYNQRQICWYGQIKQATRKNGLEGSLKLFIKLYNEQPVFAGGCHDAMHLIGDEAYREFKQGKTLQFSKETTYCGYGFYHGFIEAMLYTTGDYTEVRNFCESINQNLQGNIESPNAIYSCYHGIGHSTFDIHDPRLWGDEEKMVNPAIKVCEEVTKGLAQEKTKQCVTGVFNALGNAYGGSQYNLKMKPADPLWLCKKQIPLYRGPCFLDLSLAWISLTMGGINYNWSDAVRFIEKINDQVGEEAAMFTLASDYTRLKKEAENSAEMIKICRSVKSSLFVSCLTGVQLGLLNWGKPGEEYLEALASCNNNFLNERQREACLSYTLPLFRTLYTKDKTDQICRSLVVEKYQKYCHL